MKQKRIILLIFMLLFLTSAVNSAYSWTPQDRWFYASIRPNSDESTDKIISLLERAGRSNYNGILWAADWENVGSWSESQLARLERIKTTAEKANIEIIPILWSNGYGTMLGKNPNLAEGLPIKDLPMVASNGRAVFEPEDYVAPNGDMENWENDRLVLDGYYDGAKTRTFRDDQVKRGGKTSIRFENIETDQHGHGRLMYKLKLKPGKIYRASVWLKANELQGNVCIQAYSTSNTQIGYGRLNVKLDDNKRYNCDWSPLQVIFQVPDDGAVNVYMGIWKGQHGVMWLDDFSVEMVGFVNPLQRPGAPIIVKSEDGKTIYQQGKDWEMPKFRLSPWRLDSESQKLIIPQGSNIQENEKILVDFYYPPLVGAPQIGTCMSEPELFELFAQNAKEVQKALNPKKWFLSQDEIRCAGTCKACQDRGVSLASILADCITKQYNIIKSVNSDAEIYVWSDMFDPNHNARANYYVCKGDYTGVWDLIPKDLIISCWYYEKREASMKFFQDLGFRTQAAAYYDVDSLDTSKDWLDVCNKTPNCIGIMYTTWQNKYDLLEGFGKLVDSKK